LDAPRRPRRGEVRRPGYDNVVEDVRRFLLRGLKPARPGDRPRAHCPRSRWASQEAQENVDLVAGAGRLAEAGYPVLIGASRKASSAADRHRGASSPRSGVDLARRRSGPARCSFVRVPTSRHATSLAVSAAMR